MKKARMLVAMVASALSATAVLTMAGPAQAATPSCVADGDYGQVGGKEDATLSTGPFSRGVRSKMYAGGTATCQRISSIYIQAPNQNGFVEFGWVLGWSNCSSTTNAVPRLFYWVRNQHTGVEHCGVLSGTNPTPGTSAIYRIEDTDANTQWKALYNGAGVQSGIDVDFARGWPLVAMERGASSESGYALWDELFEFHDSNGWTQWDHPSVFVDSDPTYEYTQYSPYKLASELP